ncbi:MAG: protein BatD [Gammaproteobacteria bacterium]|nr:protein BatD [Gammaproteobacteria bacterium]
MNTQSSNINIVRYLVMAICLLLPQADLFAADIQVRISHNPVALSDSFQLVFDAVGSLDDEPDFLPLEQDFEILNRSQSQNIQMINGNVKRQTSWTLMLMARATGSFTIPAIKFGTDQSKPLPIKVLDAASSQPGGASNNLLLEVETTPAQLLVQQEMIYTVRLLVGVRLGNASLSEPRVTGTDAVVEKLGEDARYTTNRNGKRYTVIERRYAIFPQQSGKLTIDPILFEGVVGGRSRPPLGMLDDGFFGRRQNGTIKRLRSKPVQLVVDPVPKDTKVQPWLPARNLRLVDSWSADIPKLEVGEPTTRTMMLMADGLLATQLPEFAMPVPTGFKQYPDKPELKSNTDGSGVTGTRQAKSAIVPTKAGTFTIPGIKIPWWNTEMQRREVVEIPPRQVTVTGTAPTRTTPAPIANDGHTAEPEVQKQPTRPQNKVADGPGSYMRTLYPWLSLFFALGWLATALAWWRGRHRRVPQHPAEALTKNPEQAVNQIRLAYRKQEAVAAHDALLAWAAATWPQSPPTSLVDLAARLDAETGAWIGDLDRSLYGKTESNWYEAPVADALLPNTKQTTKGDDDPLTALNPPHSDIV